MTEGTISTALITLKDWFFAKDGNQYKAIYGDVTAASNGYVINDGTPDELVILRENVVVYQRCDEPPAKCTSIYFML